MSFRFFTKVAKKTQSDWSSISGLNSKVVYPEVVPTFEMYSVIRVYSESESNLDVLGKLLVDELQSAFQNNADKYDDMVLRLEDALWKMRAKLENIISKDSNLMEKGIDLELAVVVISLNILYVGIVGESKVFLSRNEKFVDISKGLIDTNMMGFAKTGSLKILHNDRLVLMTNKTFEANKIDAFMSIANDLNAKQLDDIQDVPGGAFIILGSDDLNWIEGNEQNIDSLEDKSSIHVEEFIHTKEQYHSESDISIGSIHKDNNQIRPEGDAVEESAHLKSYEDIDINTITNNQDLEETEVLFDDFDKSVAHTIPSKENLSTQKHKNLFFATFFSNCKNALNKLLISKKTYVYVLRYIFKYLRKWTEKVFIVIQSIFRSKDSKSAQRPLLTGRNKHSYQFDYRQRNRRFLYFVIAVLFIYLFFSFQNAEFNRRLDEKDKGFKSQISEYREVFSQIDADSFSINMDSAEYRSELTKKIDELSKNIRDLISQISQDVEYSKTELGTSSLSLLNQLNLDINKLRNRALKLEEINSSNLRLIIDISRQFPGSNVTSIAFTNVDGQRLIYAADNKNNNVYKVNVDRIGSVFAISTGSETSFVSPRIVTTTPDGDIVVYDNNESASISRIFVKENDRVQRFNIPIRDTVGVVAVDIFSNQSIYEIRTSPNAYIHRRLPAGSGFVTGGSTYVATNPPNWRTDLDFSSAIDIAVPYEIYVLIKGQGIKRYLSGGDNSLTQQSYINLLPDDFEAIKQATAIDVSSKYLAVADPLNKRVLLFNISQDSRKDLAFRKQYKFSGIESVLANIKDIVINETSNGGEIYLLDDNRIILINF